MADPLISIVILNYRRRAALTRTLESARQQAYSRKEVVVVDNGSDDDVADFLAAEYPEVRLVKLDWNAGCAGRNRGVEAANGEFVVTIDNDVRFDSAFELSKVAASFYACPAASCIVFKVLEADTGRVHLRDWCHPKSYWEYADKEFETCFIPEGAAAFRRRDFLRMGGYWEPLWIGHEGWDLALRMLDAGMEIVYRPEVRVRHEMASETRGAGRNYYFYIRNSIWIAFKDYAGWRRASYLVFHLAMMAWFCLRAGYVRNFLAGIHEGVEGLPNVTSTPVSKEVWRRLREIRADRPGWLIRLKKHRERPLV